MFSFQLRNRLKTSSPRIRASARFRPAVDGLEGRALLATLVVDPSSAVTAAQVAPAPAVPVFQVQGNQVVGTVTLSSQTFTVPVTALPTPSGAARSLTLRVGPIDQTARGLRVQAVPFNVTITPQSGTSLDQVQVTPPSATSLDQVQSAVFTAPGGNVPGPLALANGLNSLIERARTLNAQAGSGTLLSLNGLSLQGGRLVATGTLAGQAFTRTVTLGTSPGTTTRVRNLTLTLDPIDSTAQGLRIQTASIPLTVSSQGGRRNLLGTALGQFTRVLARNPNLAARQLGQLGRLLGQI